LITYPLKKTRFQHSSVVCLSIYFPNPFTLKTNRRLLTNWQ